MGSPYAQDLRDRVLAAYDRGMKTKQIADTFQVSPAWTRRVKQRRRETGETTARPMGGATVVKIDLVRLAELVRQQPDATCKELRDKLGVACVESAICMALQRLGLSFKKKRSTRQNKTVRTWRNDAPHGSSSNRRSTPNG